MSIDKTLKNIIKSMSTENVLKKIAELLLLLLLIALIVNITIDIIDSHSKKIKCIDGDTFAIGNVYYRLAYIDTPEKGEPIYVASSNYTCNYLKTKDFKMENKGKDIYGRELVFVYSQDDSLNTSLIRECLAEPYYSNTEDFIIRMYNNCKLYE